MDDLHEAIDNGFIVVIVQICGKFKMKPESTLQAASMSPDTNCRSSKRDFFKQTLERLRVYWQRWSRRYRLRRSLYEMDTQRIERDVGLPYGSLSEEAHKPFWRE